MPLPSNTLLGLASPNRLMRFLGEVEPPGCLRPHVSLEELRRRFAQINYQQPVESIGEMLVIVKSCDTAAEFQIVT